VFATVLQVPQSHEQSELYLERLAAASEAQSVIHAQVQQTNKQKTPQFLIRFDFQLFLFIHFVIYASTAH
jgi:uncharacterized protein (DUF2236 family)